MRLVEAAKPVFARSETFHPRYSWFRKAFTFTDTNPDVFLSDDATVQMGVGKNMVRSIRFWGLAAKLISEQIDSRRRKLSTTEIGSDIFGESGWDKYLQDPGTLWLLHWLLLSPPSLLPVWWLTFNEFSAIEFSNDDLFSVITTHLESNSQWAKPHQSSVKKDIRTLLRTYSSHNNFKHTNIEDTFDCPLRELNLISYSESTKKYRFVVGKKASLPAEIVAYAILEFISFVEIGGNTIAVNRLASEPGSPGKVFKLNEQELIEVLKPLLHTSNALKLVSTTGAMQIAWSENPKRIAKSMLTAYYDTWKH